MGKRYQVLLAVFSLGLHQASQKDLPEKVPGNVLPGMFPPLIYALILFESELRSGPNAICCMFGVGTRSHFGAHGGDTGSPEEKVATFSSGEPVSPPWAPK